MFFLLVGIVMLLMWLGDIAPVAGLPWWMVATPFGLAVAWWAWADWSGYTKKKVIDKENLRKQARIDQNREKMGLGPSKKKR